MMEWKDLTDKHSLHKHFEVCTTMANISDLGRFQ